MAVLLRDGGEIVRRNSMLSLTGLQIWMGRSRTRQRF